jgi:hypothetical protein
MYPHPRQYGKPADLLQIIQFMQNTPLNGAGRRLAPHPFLANNSFSYSNIVILSY